MPAAFPDVSLHWQKLQKTLLDTWSYPLLLAHGSSDETWRTSFGHFYFCQGVAAASVCTRSDGLDWLVVVTNRLDSSPGSCAT